MLRWINIILSHVHYEFKKAKEWDWELESLSLSGLHVTCLRRPLHYIKLQKLLVENSRAVGRVKTSSHSVCVCVCACTHVCVRARTCACRGVRLGLAPFLIPNKHDLYPQPMPSLVLGQEGWLLAISQVGRQNTERQRKNTDTWLPSKKDE